MERWLSGTDHKEDEMNAMTENEDTRIPAQAEGNTPPFSAQGESAYSSAPEAATRTAKPLPEDALIILPVRNMVLFPGALIPITIGRTRSLAAAQFAARNQRQIGVLLQRQGEVDEPGPDDLHWVGTTANVLRYVTAPDGAHHVVCQGEERFRVLQFLDGYDFLVARVQRIEDTPQDTKEIEARALSLKQRAIEILQMLPQEIPQEIIKSLQSIDSPTRLADIISMLMDATIEEKQSLLETFDLRTRLDRLLEILSRRAELLRISQEIDQRTKQSIGEKGREHLLREQLRTIQKELGEGDEGAAELE